MPVTLIKSSWSSGSLIFYEATSKAPSATYNVFSLGTGAVKVGDTANDVDFQYYGTGSLSAIIDCGAATFTLVGIATSTNGAVTITNATATSSTTTGALIVTGGIATAADITCGDDLFMQSTGVINFAAGNVTITHSTGLLTMAGGGLTMGASGTPAGDVTLWGTTALYKVWFDVNGDTNGAWFFGADDYGVDVAFYGQTTGNSFVWDASGDKFTGTFTSGASAFEPITCTTTMTGVGATGGRARFYMTTNVALGGWSNALKANVVYGASGRTTGLGSAFCAELQLSAGTTSGTYAPLESEVVTGSGGSTGTATSFLYMNVTDDAATFNTNGYLFELGSGVVDTTSGLFDVATTTPTSVEFDAQLRIRVGGVNYYIPLSADTAFE